MRCFCEMQICVCRLTYVIYKLTCKTCRHSYIGKTIRQLWVRIAEHMRGIVVGKGSALAKHACKEGYTLRVCARSQNNQRALSAMEGKMMNKYRPRINIKNERRARELAEKLGEALRDKNSCKPESKGAPRNDEDDYEDEFDYWIEDSEEFMNEVEREAADSTTTEEQASRKEGGAPEPSVCFDPANYALLVAIKAHETSAAFETMTLNSTEAQSMGIRQQEQRSFMKRLWYATPVGIWFDDERTVGEKFLNLGFNVSVIAVSIAVPIRVAAAIVATAGTAATVAIEAGAGAATGTAAAAAGTTAGAMTTMTVAKVLVKATACSAAYAIPGLGAAAPAICVYA